MVCFCYYEITALYQELLDNEPKSWRLHTDKYKVNMGII